MSLMSAIGVKRTSRGQAAMSANDPKRSTNRLRQTKGWAGPVPISSRKNHSNGGKTVQAQHCSIRYGEHNGLKTGERN